jgi:beta-glucanase (GH16 family)
MNGKHFTSGKLHSKQNWTYGKYEAKAKLPKGKNLWPAIWMNPAKDSYGNWAASVEIDIMEFRGERTDTILSGLHYGGPYPNDTGHGSGEIKFGLDFSADFHKFGLEWNQNEIKWLVDEKEFHKENINRSLYSGKGKNPYTKPGQPFDHSFYWILNLAIGGNFFPVQYYGPQVTLEEAKQWPKPTMEIDWIRVWEWK